jgi:hypothetical protein
VSSIAAATAELERAVRTERRRTYSDRLYRTVRAAIDRACDEVELINLAGGGDCPPRVSALIEYLHKLAGRSVELPSTSQQALDQLFDLADELLGHAGDDDVDAGGEDR